MIGFNNTFCPYCCNTFRSYVYVTNRNEYLSIKRNKVGTYAIHNYANCKHVQKINIKDMEKLNGLPYRTIIEIKYSDEKQERQEVLTSSKRVCPYCLRAGKKIKTLTYGGYAPTLIVVNVGIPASGKTALTQSITYSENLKKITSNDFIMQPVDTPDRMDQLVATPINATDVFYQFKITNNVGELITSVLFIDTAGEFTNQDNLENFDEFYTRYFKYLKLASHINYVIDGEKAISEDTSISVRQEKILQDIYSTKEFVNKTSVVMTKADIVRKRIIEERFPIKKAGNVILNFNCPIFTDGKMKLMELERLSKYIIRSLDNKVCNHIPYKSNSSYFVVSAGTETEDGSLNFDNAININALLNEIFGKL